MGNTGRGVELSAEQVKKRSTHYRFEYTHRSILGKGKGTLKRVVFANSAGFPIEHNFSEYVDRSSIQQIKAEKIDGDNLSLRLNIKIPNKSL